MQYLLKLIAECQPLFKPAFYVLLTAGGFAINLVIQSFNSAQIDHKLTEIRSETVHSRIDGFAGTLSAFRDEAYRMQSENKELSEQVTQLIECAKRKDCDKYPNLLKKKEYAPIDIKEAYKPIRKLLGETYTEEK